MLKKTIKSIKNRQMIKKQIVLCITQVPLGKKITIFKHTSKQLTLNLI